MASVIRSLDLELERLLELSDLIDEEDLTEIFDFVLASVLGEFDEAENCLFPKLSRVKVSSSFKRVRTLSSASRWCLASSSVFSATASIFCILFLSLDFWRLEGILTSGALLDNKSSSSFSRLPFAVNLVSLVDLLTSVMTVSAVWGVLGSTSRDLLLVKDFLLLEVTCLLSFPGSGISLSFPSDVFLLPASLLFCLAIGLNLLEFGAKFFFLLSLLIIPTLPSPTPPTDLLSSNFSSDFLVLLLESLEASLRLSSLGSLLMEGSF